MKISMSITCPHCHHECKFDDLFASMEAGMECENCHRKFGAGGTTVVSSVNTTSTCSGQPDADPSVSISTDDNATKTTTNIINIHLAAPPENDAPGGWKLGKWLGLLLILLGIGGCSIFNATGADNATTVSVCFILIGFVSLLGWFLDGL